jgi:hypothetical protein
VVAAHDLHFLAGYGGAGSLAHCALLLLLMVHCALLPLLLPFLVA